MILALCQVLAGCGDDEAKKQVGIVFSPNGEPLTGGPLGRPECPVALGRWFDRIAPGGALSLPAFLADARRQFHAMDIDRVGLLTPAELAKYRTPYEFGFHGGPHTGGYGDGDQAADGEGRRHRHSHQEGDDNDLRHDKHDVSDDRADPVMSADRHNRNEVSLDDFLVYERQNFASLDINRDGSLSKLEILKECPD